MFDVICGLLAAEVTPQNVGYVADIISRGWTVQPSIHTVAYTREDVTKALQQVDIPKGPWRITALGLVFGVVPRYLRIDGHWTTGENSGGTDPA